MTPIIRSNRNLHERLICSSTLKDNNVIKQIQNYLNYYITYYRMINAFSEKGRKQFELKISFSANGITITEQESERLINTISHLGDYDSFELEVRYYGMTGDLYENIKEVEFNIPDTIDNYIGMYDYLEPSKERNLDYTVIAYYEDDDEVVFKTISKDDDFDFASIAEPGDDLLLDDTNDFSMLIGFDFDEYQEQFECIKDIVIDFADEDDDLELTKEIWDEGEWIGFSGLSVHTTGEIAQMLEEVNEVLASIDDDIKFKLEGTLFDLETFTAAHMFEDENKIFLQVQSFE